MKNPGRRRAAHVPHRSNAIRTAMHIVIASRQAAAPVTTKPTDKSASEVPAAPGAHFAGLIARELQTPSLNIRDAPAANDADADDDVADDAASSRDHSARWGKASLMQTIAKRLIEAREINGLAQHEAAALLQYATPAQLSQWEQCRRAPPLHMLMRASEAYGVSMDYLTGVSPEPDRDARAARRNATVRAVRATLVGAAERVVAAMDLGEGLIGLNAATVRELVAAAEAVAGTFGDFVQQSRVARVADRLAVAIERLESASLKAGIALRRHDCEDAEARQRLAEIAANDPN